MKGYTLFTYRSIKELRKIQKERDVYQFVFQDTMEQLEENTDVCIDISSLICYLRVNRHDILSACVNFRPMANDTKVIIRESLVDDAIDLFPLLFLKCERYFPISVEGVKDATNPTAEMPVLASLVKRRPVYKYNHIKDLDKIISYAYEHNIPIATFSQASQDMRDEFDSFNKSEKMTLLDLTSASYAIENNKNLIYALEQLISAFSNTCIIVQTPQVDVLLEYFPLFFDHQEPISNLLPDLNIEDAHEAEDERVLKVTDLDNEAFCSYMDDFCHNLVGHHYFKERLNYLLKNFRTLNTVKEQKVLSIFLFGASGIGKTEVARLLANGLSKDCYLAKINFQNYSSQDALNSLIGSPAGYVGCTHGELSEKINKSKVGVLLCDEFEKTTRPVFSFFLELLEEGQFTDSMAREYDLDGYIVVFTSNIQHESDYKKEIPPELQTRFDLVCQFEEPSVAEKTKFLDLLLERAKEKYSDKFSNFEMTQADRDHLYDFDYSGLSALRDIKRAFNNRLMDLFGEKGV